jgi:hypothetical protein
VKVKVVQRASSVGTSDKRAKCGAVQNLSSSHGEAFSDMLCIDILDRLLREEAGKTIGNSIN